MRAIGKVLSYIAAIVVTQTVCIFAANAATYTATQVDTGTMLRNNNGALVKQTSTTGSVPEDSTSAVTVTIAGKILAIYNSPAGTTDQILAINDAEALVGFRRYGFHFRAILLRNGTVTDLHAEIASALGADYASSDSFAYDINNSGTIVGYINSSPAKAFQYKNGVVTDLGALAGVPMTAATSINNFGQIVAQGSDSYKALLYSNGVVQTLQFSDPSFGPLPINAQTINDAGQVTGTIPFPVTNPAPHAIPPLHAFIYEGGAVKDISGNLQQYFNRTTTNNTGTIVGSNGSRSALYKDGLWVDLNEEVDAASIQNRPITNVYSINDDGVILADASVMTVLLTPISTPQLDPSVFNFEAGAQGWESAGEPILTMTNSSAQKFAGEKSLAMQFNDHGFAAVRVLNPTVKPGQTISFRVFIPTTSKIDWVQPYGLGSAADSWAWYGNWTPIQALQLGAWNTLTVSIPADAPALHSIGLELFASQPNPGEVFLDSVDYGVTMDAAQYSFESGTQGWTNKGDPIATVATSTAQVFAGRKSLALNVNGTGLARIAIDNPGVLAGQTISFHVFIPEGAGIDWIQPFALEGASGNWRWHGNWQPTNALQANAWNTITVDIPTNASSIAALGLELSVSDANARTVYLDSVSY